MVVSNLKKKLAVTALSAGVMLSHPHQALAERVVVDEVFNTPE